MSRAASKALRDFIIDVVKPLKRRVFMLVARGILDSVTDSGGVQTGKYQLLADEVRDGLERLQEFGFTSTPIPGAEAAIVFPNGNRENGLVVALADRRGRPTDIPAGGAAIYSVDSAGAKKQVLKILPDGTIELGEGTLEKIFNCETFQAYFNTHDHIGNLGVPTGPPITPSGASHLSSKVKAVT